LIPITAKLTADWGKLRTAVNENIQRYSSHRFHVSHAHFCLGNFADAVDAYERGLRLDPSNASMKQSLAAAQQKLDETDGAVSRDAGAGGAGVGGIPGLGGGPGGMDFASMLSNPNFMNMGKGKTNEVCQLS
jgi:hypothetical protein